MIPRITLLFALVTTSLLTMGQATTVELTFTAVDSTAYVQLDSVKVLNRTQGGETMLYWPDTTLPIEITPGDLLLFVGYTTFYPVGIQRTGQGLSQFQLLQNFPNPVKDQSVISMNIPEKGSVNMMITDVQGRMLLASDRQLDQGNHTFRFIPGNGNLYFFTARWNGISRTIKILATGQNRGLKCVLDYTGTSTAGSVLKASPQSGNFISLESAIIDAPDASKSYSFQFATGTPCPGHPAVEYDGQVYNTLQIFSQCWLKENLNAGTMIGGTIEQSNNRIIEKYCYDDNQSNCDIYGGLYRWNEAMQYSTVQLAKGICPPGWHLPMDEEWKVLEGALDGQYGFGDPEWDTEGYRGQDAGGSLKEAGTAHWGSPNLGATNSSGFTGLPGGNTDYGTGDFTAMGTGGSFWSSTQSNTEVTWYRALNYVSPHVYRKYIDKASGYSVRCLKGCAPVQSHAGEDATVCEGAGYTLSGATAASYTGLLWTTSGTGSFDDPTVLNPTYTPSQEDLFMAEVMLTLTASGGGVCADAESAMTLMITGAPSIDAGEDADICSTQSSYMLNGSADNYSSLLWTTNGSGTFNDSSSLTATYTPSTGDKMNGTINFTLTVNGNGPCDPVSDAMTLRIWTGTAYAGPDQQDVPGTSTMLAGNAPTFGEGVWEIVSGTGGNIDDPNDPHSGFHGMASASYSLKWTISNPFCETSADMVVINFASPWSCGDPIVDERDSQSYPTVLIGDQCWLAKNMNIGTMVSVNSPGQWQFDNGVIEKFCYNNQSSNCDIYGGLYEWREAMQYVTSEGAQGICPVGWHFSTDGEWLILEGTVDSQYGIGDPEWDGEGYRGFDAGGNLKETGTVHWNSPNNATNSSGFSALGGGTQTSDDGLFWEFKTLGAFWTSTQADASTGVCRMLRNDLTTIFRYTEYDKNFAFSIRCLKDD